MTTQHFIPFVASALLVLTAATPLCSADPPSQEQPTTPSDDSSVPSPYAGRIEVLEPADIEPRLGDDVRVKQLGFVKGLRYLLLTKWKAEKPSDPAALAQIRIPTVNDAVDPATLVMSESSDASPDDTIARWVAQFTELEGVAEQQDLQIRNTPLLVTQVVATGTYDAAEPGAEPDLRPGTTLLGAVIQGGPQGTVLAKAVGPKEALKDRRGSWDVFLRNLRVMDRPVNVSPATGHRKDEPAKPAGEPGKE